MSGKTEWVMVPRVATREMWDAWHGAPDNTDDDIACNDAYASMLAAAPQPPAEAQAQGGGEVFGWVLGDAFVDARYWTADAPPLGWTPVYCTAPPSAPPSTPPYTPPPHRRMTMREDLIERLRNFEVSDDLGNGDFSLLREAAAAIESAREDGPDAERYRWLRDRHDKTHQDWHVRDQWNNAPAIGGLDAAIDQARGKGES